MNAFYCAFHVWVSGKNNRDTTWMHLAHGSNNCVTVTFLFDVEATQQQVKVLSFYLLQGLMEVAASVTVNPFRNGIKDNVSRTLRSSSTNKSRFRMRLT
jgi:hypothetical protein